MKRFPAFESYTVKNNTIDLTTKPIDENNQGCLVDRKLVDLLIRQVVGIPFEEAKEAILNHMKLAMSFEELKNSFEESIYIHEVCEKIQQADSKIEDEVRVG
jgi:hypothetical protein